MYPIFSIPVLKCAYRYTYIYYVRAQSDEKKSCHWFLPKFNTSLRNICFYFWLWYILIGSVMATLGDDSAACTAVNDDGSSSSSSNSGGDVTFSGRSVAEVRDGHLLIRWDGPAGYCWKLLLRYLNLTPSEHAVYGFNLVRPGCESPIIAIVVSIWIYFHYDYHF